MADEGETETKVEETDEEKSDLEKITSGVKITEKQLSNLLDFGLKYQEMMFLMIQLNLNNFKMILWKKL